MRTAHVAALCFLVLVTMFVLGFYQAGLTRAQTECDLDCVNAKITALTKRIAALELKTGITKPKAAATGVAKESFVNIAGGSVVGSDWLKVPNSDFWFDQSLYGNVSEVTWQGWIENGDGQARLYDSTNNRVVDGSEVTVTSGNRASFYSKALTIWRGQNMYYVQLKSPAAGLVTISSPRLRVVTR